MEVRLQNTIVRDYATFHNAFLGVLNNRAPYKKKLIRANHKPYVTKKLRKAILRRSRLENRFHKNRTAENSKVL